MRAQHSRGGSDPNVMIGADEPRRVVQRSRRRAAYVRAVALVIALLLILEAAIGPGGLAFFGNASA